MTLNKYIGMTGILAILACGGSADAPTETRSVASQKKVANSKSCLEQYAMEPCKLLTLQEVAGLADVNPELVEMKPPLDMFKDPMMRACVFNWPSARKMTVKTAVGNFESEVDNQILIGSFQLLDQQKRKIEVPYEEWFDNHYRQMTTEEKERFNKLMDKELDERLENNEEKEVAKDLGDGVMGIVGSINYELQAGIGDKAVAEISPKYVNVRLNVLHGNIVFTVDVNTSDERDENLALAKKVSKAVLALCD